MLKKLSIILLSVILVVSCFAGCNGTSESTPTEAPATEAPAEKATDAPTAEPTATVEPSETDEPTESPTETPKIEVLNVDSVMTDMSTDVEIEVFTMSNATFEKDTCYAYVTGSDSDSGYVSLRLYDMRLIDAVLEENSEADRTLADATKYGYWAIKYKIDADVELTDQDYCVSTDATNIVSPPDSISYASKPFTQDGQWHVLIINIKEELPNVYACSESGDPFDCVTVPVPTSSDYDYLIAWYGCFQSEEDINAWDENYTARFAKDLG